MLTNLKKIILKKLFSKIIKFRVFKYLIAGIIINISTACVYFSLVFLNFSSVFSLTVSYILGVLSSIFINKNYTFEYKEKSFKVWYQFAFIHILCFILSQITNESFLFILQPYKLRYLISYLISIGIAATINFVLMTLVIHNIHNAKTK